MMYPERETERVVVWTRERETERVVVYTRERGGEGEGKREGARERERFVVDKGMI